MNPPFLLNIAECYPLITRLYPRYSYSQDGILDFLAKENKENKRKAQKLGIDLLDLNLQGLAGTSLCTLNPA